MLAWLTVDWYNVLVQCVHTVVLMGALWFILRRPVVERVERRRAAAIRAVAGAEQVRAALRETEAKRSEILTQAHLEAEEIIQAARSVAQGAPAVEGEKVLNHE